MYPIPADELILAALCRQNYIVHLVFILLSIVVRNNTQDLCARFTRLKGGRGDFVRVLIYLRFVESDPVAWTGRVSMRALMCAYAVLQDLRAINYSLRRCLYPGTRQRLGQHQHALRSLFLIHRQICFVAEKRREPCEGTQLVSSWIMGHLDDRMSTPCWMCDTLTKAHDIKEPHTAMLLDGNERPKQREVALYLLFLLFCLLRHPLVSSSAANCLHTLAEAGRFPYFVVSSYLY